MDVCVRCHRETLRTSVIASAGPLFPHVQNDLEKADATVIEKKASSEEWKSYLRLRAAEPK
jgi:hypothetical protein